MNMNGFIMTIDQNSKQKHIKNKNIVKMKQDKIIHLMISSSLDNESLLHKFYRKYNKI